MADYSLHYQVYLRAFQIRGAWLRIVVLMLALATVGCNTGQQPVSAAPQPEPGQPVYDTHVRFDLENATLAARTKFSYVADQNTAARIALLLNRGLELEAVSGEAVRSYRLESFPPVPTWNVIEVELHETIAPGSHVTLELTYSGRPEFPEDNINGISPEWVELNLDSQWHPIFAGFDQAMRGVLRAELPLQWEVIASGSVALEEGLHVVRSSVPQPDVAFTAAPSFDRLHSGNLTVYSRDAGRRTAASLLAAGENCVRYLNTRYGARDPLPPGKLVLADRDGPGYARKNYIVLSQVDPEDPVGLHYFLCHELAHYWTPSPGSRSPDHWMSEAFAEYVAVRYLREHFGQETFDRLATRWEEMGREHGPVWTPEAAERPTFQMMYRRAPHLLLRLEQRIGTERFDRFLERYMTEDVYTTLELLEILAAVAGPEAAQWFREELARAS